MQSRKILVIDDEVMVADISRSALTSAGHQVFCAYSGEQAVEMAMALRFDLAIIDAMLPGMNGIETFELIRQSCPYIKGILVSGDLTVNMTLEAMDKGFCRVLVKPVQAGYLLLAVQAALADYDLQEENIRLNKQVSKMRTLFEQYMAPEVAAILLDQQKSISEVAGEVQEITVLFADIRNFTFLVQYLPLQESREFLTEFFDMVADVVSSWHGILDKFIGDAALAIFGAPVPHGSPSLSAVSAALEIQKSFEVLRARWALTSDLFMQIGLGIGVSRGEMFLGNVGSGRRLDYTVIGADVNIAQRLASETVAGQILITESVYCDVVDKVSIQEEKTRLLRGMEKKIQIYSIIP
ncbi:MAG: adenylate/guanylate cyclase domain-containing response regulator [Proteobacteria bacterium]|nr:adenylate/guanylate cyclase domain-containing response regulator [Pseudomonadota bacterium]MBU1649518.1 adenylate/guanylate cyclase domain-containing response regulator [Pseudomonadota bacterium]MBU1986605.1 adenylate/guanylate cyclase domain-containing response regulator [Pseudomonadota bacterium]